MLLHSLIDQLEPKPSLAGVPNVDVSGVQEDSRRVTPGCLFVARPGAQADGRAYVADAARRGAVAVVSGARLDDCPLPQVVVGDVAAATSWLANVALGRPSRAVRVLGVTGTNGKTTVAFLVRHILHAVHRRCGVVGTVEIDDGVAVREATMTTPGAVEVAELLAAMRDNGCGACAMEVSSHGLDQGRVAGVEFAAAAFTNLTGDHFDYHGTEENYAAAKARLFTMLRDNAVAIVNADDPASERMVADCHIRVVRWGFSAGAQYRATEIDIKTEGSTFVLATPDGAAPVRTPLVGQHNIANALTAAALVSEVFGLGVGQIAGALADATGAPGRLQAVRCGQPFTVMVDYAHTDDALKNVLTALRPLARAKLRVLFGCGGDRDRTKRRRMAEMAAEYADAVYVTSDNPRTEEPGAIIDEILAGIPAAKRGEVVVERDRRSAIERIITESGEGDVVLLAGKGHENYQIVGKEKRHFDDVEEARRAIARSAGAGSR